MLSTLKHVLWFLAFVAISCGQASEAPIAIPTPKPWRPPNFIVIVFDDARRDDFAHMAEIQEELVAQGVTFTTAYAPAALCCPSRASILTGMYEHNHGIFTNDLPQGGYQGFRDEGYEQQTIAVRLQQAGYETMISGKYLNHYDRFAYDEVPPGWDELYIPVPQNRQFGYSLRTRFGWESFGDGPDDFEGDVVFQKARDFAVRTPEPFFAYVNPVSPHVPHDSAHRHLDRFRDLPFTYSPSFDEEDIEDKPRMRELPRISRHQERVIIDTWRSRLRSMLAPSEQIKLLVEDLRRAGRLENTYIIATSDNGWFLGEHRRIAEKLSPYEVSTHMPLIIRGPHIPPGTSLDHPVTLVDIAPTLLELAHQPIPESMDGMSWAPLLSRTPMPASHWRQAVLYETIPWFQAIRTRNHTYIQWSSGEPEVYDMVRDPYQLENLVWLGRPPQELSQLQDQFNLLTSCRGRSCRP